MVTLRDWLAVYLKGVAMGCADAVPGVSGGTIALIVGVYERLIAAITNVTPERIRRVLAGAHPRNLPDARAAFLELDGAFLAVLGAGIATAIVTVLRVVDHLLETLPVPTFGFFFGLIAASAVVLYAEVDLSTRDRKAAAAGGFLLAFLTSGYASSALGAGSLPVLFVAGAAVGLFTVAHAVRRALERDRAATLAFLVSLIVGALRAPVAEVGRVLAETGGTWRAAAPEFAVAAVGGALAVVLLDRYSGAIEY